MNTLIPKGNGVLKDISELLLKKLIVIDVDGCLTDNNYITGYNVNSKEACISKSFNTKDFTMIHHLLKNDCKVIFLTGSQDLVIDIRIDRLLKSNWKDVDKNNISIIKCDGPKLEHLIQYLSDKYSKSLVDHNIYSLKNIFYIGDSSNDYTIMSNRELWYKACPANADEPIKNLCNYVSQVKGGEGAIWDIFYNVFSIKYIYKDFFKC